MRPTVVLNALALVPDGSGVQTYEREMVWHLPHALDLPISVVAQRRARGLLPPGIDVRVRPDLGAAARNVASLLPLSARGTLVHGLDTLVPMGSRGPTVSTVHDLALFDLPDAFSARTRAVKGRAVAGSIRRADAVIAVSEFTAERVRHWFGRDCAVVPEAPGAWCTPPPVDAVEQFRARAGLPERFVAYVGNVEPRKDLPVLGEACREARVPLVVAGGHLAPSSLPPGAHRLGYLPAEELRLLYASASVVAYVSRYEGFGLPPIEALACGAVVMATPVGALPSVADGAIELVPVGDATRQASSLRALLDDDDLRVQRRSAGLDATRRLTWAAAAEGTAAVYRTLGVA